jgi:hypothetical protein
MRSSPFSRAVNPSYRVDGVVRKPSRVLGGLLLSVLIVVSLASCAAFATIPIPSKSELAGTWHGPRGATIVLRKDGTASLDGIPTEALLATSSSGGAKLNLTGTWQLGDGIGGKRSDGYPEFDILIDHAKSPTSPIDGLVPLVSGKGASLKFFWIIGDPDNDNKYTFSR